MPPESTDGIAAAVRTFFVRSADTGEVVHLHEEVTFPHTPPVEGSAEERAIRLAGDRARGCTVEEVEPGERPAIDRLSSAP